MFSRAGINRSLTVAALLALAVGCRRAPPGVTRLAVLPVENLTAEPSLDWLCAAAPGVIASQLAPVSEVHAFASGAIRDAYAARANRVLHSNLAAAAGGLRLSCVLEDLEQRRVARSFSASVPDRTVLLDLLSQVSRALSGKARPLPTSNPEALRLLMLATDAADFERATAADPNFGAPYIAWARWLAARGRQPEALKALSAARARGDRIAPLERTEIAALAASLEGDREARVRALAELAALTPADAQPPRALGQLEYAAWRLEAAISWYRRALTIEPDTAELWNMIAYAQAQRSEFDAAEKSISAYVRLAPDNPNTQDSLGDIYFMAGGFAAAEKSYLAASAMNPSWEGGGPLLKAAYARVMSGDVGGADGILAQYLEMRRTLKDPLVAYRRAQWEFVTGRRRQALERMEAFRAAAEDDPAAHAAAQLAVWRRQLGDAAGARRLALEAARRASAPATRRLAALLAFVTEPPASASEWAVRAERAFEPSEAAMKHHALAYALLLNGHFREASVLLRQMIQRTPPPAAGELRTLVAWALIESGQLESAREFASPYPPPEGQGEPTFASLAMPRLLWVRSRLATGEEAARLAAVYDKLKGDLPDAPNGPSSDRTGGVR